MENSSIRYCKNFSTYDDFENYKKVLTLVDEGNVMEEGPKVETPDHCKLQFKEHQKRIIYEMMQKEDEKQRVSKKLNLFVISDKVGSGKSMNVLGLISHKPRVDDWVGNIIKYKPDNAYDFIGYEINKEESVFLRTNLIVVPHSIYYQWIEYIGFFPNLTYCGIEKKLHIDNLNIDDLKEGKYDIILIKSTKYNGFMDKIYESCALHTETVYKDCHSSSKVTELDNNIYDTRCKMKNIANGIGRRDPTIDYKSDVANLIEALVGIQEFDMDNVKDLWKETIIDRVVSVRGPIFDRVFFDEANSINLPNCRTAYAKYNWFITSSLYDLFFPKGSKQYRYHISGLPDNVKGIYNHGFIRNTFSINQVMNNYRFLQDIYLKNNDQFIKNSFSLDAPIKNYIMCFTPIHIKLLDKVALPNIIDALNANDMTTAMSLVNGNIKSDKDISRLVLSTLSDNVRELDEKIKLKKLDLIDIEGKIKEEKDILKVEKEAFDEFMLGKTLEEELDEIIEVVGLPPESVDFDSLNEKYKELKSNYSVQKKILETQNSKKYTIKTAIKKNTERLLAAKNKHDSLKERIDNVANENCPICLEKAEKPTLVPCCKQVYCFECLMYCLNASNNQCALCRTPCSFNECIVVDNNYEKAEGKGKDKEKEDKLLTKIEKILDLVKDCKGKTNKRFLIFSSYENSFSEIESALTKNEINYSLLKGSTGRIKNIINDYTEGKVNILLLNAKFFGSGLNLQMTSDIVMYHRMDNELEKQIIGRGQRLGRVGALRVHYLCHENEIRT